MRTVKSFGTVLTILALLAGCSSGTIGVKPDIAAHHLEVGKSTRTEVVNAIGLPQRVAKDAAGNDHYFYERSARLIGMCLGCGYVDNSLGAIPAAAIQSSNDKARKTAIEFVFNAEGTLIGSN